MKQVTQTSSTVAKTVFHQVRTLLVESYPHLPPGVNWDVRRWDGRFFYDAGFSWHQPWLDEAQRWLTDDGSLAGICWLDDDLLTIQIDHRHRHLEAEMLEWAQQTAAAETALRLFVWEHDTARRELAEKNGFVAGERTAVLCRMNIPANPPPLPPLPAGYILRTTSPADAPGIAALLNAAFGRSFHNAAEYSQFRRRAPCFFRDLDLIAIAPDATVAAYVGIPYEPVNKLAIFEPVCTHPAHLRRGLARTLMQLGLRRLVHRGAREVIVETGTQAPANALYDSLGFTQMERGRVWRKP